MMDSNAFLVDTDLPVYLLQQAAVTVKHSSDCGLSEMEASKYGKHEMDRTYGGRWVCVVGRDFSSQLTPQVQRFALFRTPRFAVLLFQLPHSYGRLHWAYFGGPQDPTSYVPAQPTLRKKMVERVPPKPKRKAKKKKKKQSSSTTTTSGTSASSTSGSGSTASASGSTASSGEESDASGESTDQESSSGGSSEAEEEEEESATATETEEGESASSTEAVGSDEEEEDEGSDASATEQESEEEDSATSKDGSNES